MLSELANLVALLPMNLFTHRDLWAWLNHPFQIDSVPYEPEQLFLSFAYVRDLPISDPEANGV